MHTSMLPAAELHLHLEGAKAAQRQPRGLPGLFELALAQQPLGVFGFDPGGLIFDLAT